MRDADSALGAGRATHRRRPRPLPRPRAAVARRRTDIVHVQDPYRASVALRFGCFLPPVRSPRDKLVTTCSRRAPGRALRSAAREDRGSATRLTSARRAAWRHRVAGRDRRRRRQGRRRRRWPSCAAGSIARSRSRRPQALRTAALAEGAPQRAPQRHQRRDRARDFDAWNMGWAPAVLDDYPRDLATITPDEVTAAFHACRGRSVITCSPPRPSRTIEGVMRVLAGL